MIPVSAKRNSVTRPKTQHTFPNHFSMPECAKAHLKQSRIARFFRGRTRTLRFLGGDKGKRKMGEGGIWVRERTKGRKGLEVGKE